MKNVSCNDCRFYKEADASDRFPEMGECRRYPPKIIESLFEQCHSETCASDMVAMSSFFPKSEAWSVCGEFQPS